MNMAWKVGGVARFTDDLDREMVPKWSKVVRSEPAVGWSPLFFIWFARLRRWARRWALFPGRQGCEASPLLFPTGAAADEPPQNNMGPDPARTEARRFRRNLGPPEVPPFPLTMSTVPNKPGW